MGAGWHETWRDTWRTIRGVTRSLRIYYGDRSRRAAMDQLYRRFVKPGDLVFDIGAHVGDRTAAFRRLGARVIAVEPQPALIKTLQVMFAHDRNVTVEPLAVGRSAGVLDFKLNLENPTVSTASDAFLRAAKGAPGWERQSWTKIVPVPVTTLDTLVVRHGRPAFIKIDVEGFEAEALAGLSQAPPALSFEFTTIARDVAVACVERCTALGYGTFNAVIGERHSLVHSEWVKAQAITAWVNALPHRANSGDIYARLH
jgi:FkbM family methyltransferase